MALPSLRSLRGTFMNDDVAFNSDKFHAEEIRLISSSVGASSLRCLAGSMGALRLFTYSHWVEGPCEDFDFYNVIESLRESASHNLKRLLDLTSLRTKRYKVKIPEPWIWDLKTLRN